MDELIKCPTKGCAGRYRRGGLCPLHGTGEEPDASTNARMRQRVGDLNRGGGRQARVDGQPLPRDVRKALRIAILRGGDAA